MKREPHAMRRLRFLYWLPAAVLLLTSCAGEQPTAAPPLSISDAHALIDRSLPRHVPDRDGWNTDMYAAFTALTVTPNRENICAVVAVIEQESGFRVDPVIPNLGPIARKEIEARAACARAHADREWRAGPQII
jgi:hypothetical protein